MNTWIDSLSTSYAPVSTETSVLTTKFLREAMYKFLDVNKKTPPNFIASNYCGDYIQFRFPRSKKKRIQDRWRKRWENFFFKPWDYLIFYEIGNCYYGHPNVIDKLKGVLNEGKETNNTL